MGWKSRGAAARPGDTCRLQSERRSERYQKAAMLTSYFFMLMLGLELWHLHIAYDQSCMLAGSGS